MPALFYHVTHSPVEAVVETLLTRALAQGWRVELRGTDPARMDWLDQKLWLGPEEGFLPHGLAGGPHDDLQPVLLTVAPQPAERQAVMAVDGAEVAAEEVARAERVWILFDGRNETAVAGARAQWKTLTAAGAKAQYWSEEGGRWEKKAER
ncbi:DNA polymerase III subunit chi [Rhodobacter maris]|uniref:DNA polymerase III chi subunit n=1 Tax=Rhodobacter maris TaxID=446682 RepID=A0A285RYF8_9RHOB|nr:DNA polymerase III subunit chi [Rhodobacter maris]SOB99630.1 DNA polymerase III chi subunit [Rhodobacter maris]